MANDYMDSWELNGDTVLLQDFGKGKNGGVGVLDENGKIPLANAPAIYTSNLITSKKDPRKMTLEEWTNRAVPFLNTYGTIWNDDTSEYIVTNYYADLDIKFAHKVTNSSQSLISIKGSPYQPVSFGEIFYCVGNVLGRLDTYCYMDDLTLRSHNYTFITPPSQGYQELATFVLNNTLFLLLCKKNMANSTYVLSLMTSTDGINFVEQYEHASTYLGGGAYTAAYNNGIYVFASQFFTLTIKDNTFYYNEENERSSNDHIYFFKGVFTDLRQWSTDGITWTSVSYPDGEPSGSTGMIGVLFNKIVFEDNHLNSSFWYTEDGKVIHAYAFDLYIGEHIHANKLRSMHFTTNDYTDNGMLLCVGAIDSNNDYRKVIYVTKDAEHFTELFTINVQHGSSYFVYDKGKAYIYVYDSDTYEVVLHKQSPDPDLWLPYSTHKNYIKGGN